MKSSPHVCCDVDNIIIYGSDARVYVLNSALQVIWVACGGVSKPLSISLFSDDCFFFLTTETERRLKIL